MPTNNIFNSNISAEEFLHDYWQKKPLLIRGAFSADSQLVRNGLVSPEELAGFSLEDEIESRLISSNKEQQDWSLEHGPLDPNLFTKLGESHWTLLVQSLDYFHPPLQKLIQTCDFIPRWRLDDVMVSFATKGGGVGPHLDKYDVFLIQGQGQRHWRVGHKDQIVESNNPHPEIAQIESFKDDIDVIVKAGDLLYIPPNTPHWGISEDDSVCYSVGFRAPNIGSVLQGLMDDNYSQLDELWQDENVLSTNSSQGELPSDISQWALSNANQLFNQRDLTIAIGKQVTELKYPEMLEIPSSCETQELSELAFNKPFRLRGLARLAFFKDNSSAENLLCFINGELIVTEQSFKPLLEKLNLQTIIEPKDLVALNKDKLLDFLAKAISLGAIEIQP